MFISQCPRCRSQFEAEEFWIGQPAECPHCHSVNLIESPIPYYNYNNGGGHSFGYIAIGIGISLGVLLLFCCLILFLGTDYDYSSTNQDDYGSYDYQREYERTLAKDFMDDLPDGQANALRGRGGSLRDQANASMNFAEADAETRRAIINSLERGDL